MILQVCELLYIGIFILLLLLNNNIFNYDPIIIIIIIIIIVLIILYIIIAFFFINVFSFREEKKLTVKVRSTSCELCKSIFLPSHLHTLAEHCRHTHTLQSLMSRICSVLSHIAKSFEQNTSSSLLDQNCTSSSSYLKRKRVLALSFFQFW